MANGVIVGKSGGGKLPNLKSYNTFMTTMDLSPSYNSYSYPNGYKMKNCNTIVRAALDYRSMQTARLGIVEFDKEYVVEKMTIKFYETYCLVKYSSNRDGAKVSLEVIDFNAKPIQYLQGTAKLKYTTASGIGDYWNYKTSLPIEQVNIDKCTLCTMATSDIMAFAVLKSNEIELHKALVNNTTCYGTTTSYDYELVILES